MGSVERVPTGSAPLDLLSHRTRSGVPRSSGSTRIAGASSHAAAPCEWSSAATSVPDPRTSGFVTDHMGNLGSSGTASVRHFTSTSRTPNTSPSSRSASSPRWAWTSSTCGLGRDSRTLSNASSGPESDGHCSAYRYWTLKEAHLKAAGLGMNHALAAIDVSEPGPVELPEAGGIGTRSWTGHILYEEVRPRRGPRGGRRPLGDRHHARHPHDRSRP